MEENKAKKEMTLDGLAGLITETRKALEAKIDSAEESLAASTQKQFLANQEHMDKKFAEVDERFDKMDSKIDNLELEVKNRRVHVFTHKDLEQRVEKVEEKVESIAGRVK